MRGELADAGQAGAVQVVADHLLGRRGQHLRDEQLEDEHDQHADEQLDQIEVVGVDADLVRDPGELDHREREPSDRCEPAQEPDVASPQSGGVPEDGGDRDRGDGQSEDPTGRRVAEIAS